MSHARIVFLTLVSFLVGVIVGYAGVVAAFFGVGSLTGVHDKDGGAGMAVVSVLAPTAAVVIGSLTAVVVALKLFRRREILPAASEQQNSADQRLLLGAIGLLAGLVLGWQGANVAQYVLKPFIFESRVAFRLFENTHKMLTPLGGLLGVAGAWLLKRR